MGRIRLLDDHLISQIAAGEVVERPASVVKELVENALDAGAEDVRVELESGGKRRLVIIDDGSGMGNDDALMAFDRHATSKIQKFTDLEQVGTLGFRGEALASIAAVARVELRTAETPGDGHRVRIEGGRVKSVEPVSHPRGTRIEVASLFFNVPARRKFLKKPETELRRCMEVVQGYALAHPGTRFTVVHEGRTLLDAPPAGEGIDGLRERIAQVFGRDLERKLVEIPLDFVGEEEAITGFVGDKSSTRGRRLFLYVNRRLIRDRVLLARFYRAVRDTWHTEDYPALFLFLEVRPESVDVNVHPQKSEVRFRDAKLLDRIENALRQTLEGARKEGNAPLSSPRSLPDLPATWEGLGGRRRDSGSAEPGPAYGSPFSGSGAGVGPGTAPGADPSSEIRQRPLPGAQGELPGSPPPDPFAAPAPTHFESGGESGGVPDGEPDRRPPPGQPLQSIARPTYRPIEPRSVPLSGRGKHLSPFRLLGQYKGSLILLEGHDGLYLVDQHAAHERVLFERLRRTMHEREPVSQSFLEPIILNLAPTEAMRLDEMSPALEACGFGVSVMSGNDVALTAAPDILKIEDAEALVHKLATGDGPSSSDVDVVRRRILENLAADMSCKAAIKIHRPMPAAEMEALISELFEAEDPYACPHGRPTVLTMGDAELERRFGRRG